MEIRNKMNKKGFLPRDIVLTGLLFTGIIAIFIIAIAGIAGNYENTDIIDEGFSDNYNKMANLTSTVNKMQTASQSGSGLSFIGTFDVIFSGTFSVIQMIFTTISLYGSITANFVSDFTFLDASVIKLLFTIGLGVLITIIVFAWISSIMKGKI